MKEKEKGNKEDQQQKNKKLSLLSMIEGVLILLILIAVPLFLYEGYKYKAALDEYNSIPEMSDVPATKDMPVLEVPPEEYPEETLFVEKARSEFVSGDLHLIIPRMGVDDDVMDGTDKAALKQGPGLYTVAQMPRPGFDVNTSIAAHRAGYGRYGNLFKEIHTLTEGDYLYLYDKEWIYQYQYKDTKVVTPKDVSVLYLQGFTCLTLTSCHPLGDNKERIIVRAELKEAFPFDEAFEYKMCEEE